jgi:hypothetical protein
MKNCVWILALIAAVFALIMLVGEVVLADIKPPNRPNSVGVDETYQNPNTYLLALPVDGQILDGRFTNIRFQPYATAALFDQTVLFCGDVTEQFDGKRGPVVLTYLTQASGMYQGVGCHTLLSVFEVKGGK